MRNNEKGFTGLIIVLVVVLVGLVGLGAWKVYQDSETNYENPQRETNQPATQEESNIETAPEGYETYEDESAGLTLLKPEGWNTNEENLNSNVYSLFVTFESPDYRASSSGLNTVAAGTRFSVTVSDTEHRTLETYKQSVEGASGYYTNISETEVDGKNAIRATCGHPQTGVCVDVLHAGKVYSFSHRYAGDQPQYSAEFDRLIDSIQIK